MNPLAKFCTALIFLICLGCANSMTLDNVVTASHQKVRGEQVSLIPPKGFKPSRFFVGFVQQETEAVIRVDHFMGSISYQDEVLTNPAFLERGGMKILHKEPATVNGMEGFWVEMSIESPEGSYRNAGLYFGDDNGTFTVTAIYPTSIAHNLEEALKSSIKTVVYHPEDQFDLEEAMPFGISVSADSFVNSGRTAQSLTYSMKNDGYDNVTLEISAWEEIVPSAERKEFVRLQLDYDWEFDLLDSLQSVEIDHLQGFSAISKGLDDEGESIKAYMLWLFSEDGYYLYKATTNGNFEEYLKLFQEVGATFRRK